MVRWVVLASLAGTMAALTACVDLDVDRVKWSCTQDEECGSGWLCGTDAYCVPAVGLGAGANPNFRPACECMYPEWSGRLTVKPAQKVPAPRDRVAGLNGLNGSPLPVVAGDPGLDYWYRDGNDGAHVSMVRIGADSDCALSLESIFPDPAADVEDPQSYEFAALDKHVAAIKALNTAEVVWQVAYSPGMHGQCLTLPDGEQRGAPLVDAAAGDTFQNVVVHTLRHLNNGPKDWDPAGHAFGVRFVEFMGDPIRNLGYTPDNVDTIFPRYRGFAGAIKAWWKDKADGTPTIYVGGMSFYFSEPAELAQKTEGAGDWPVVFRLIDYCAQMGVALDFVSFRTRTATPYAVAEIASEIGTHITERAAQYPALAKTQLMVTGIDVAWDDPDVVNSGVLYDPHLKSAFLGAFQAAARIYLQELWNTHEVGANVPIDVRVSWGLAGRGPRVNPELIAGGAAGATPIPSAYFGPGPDGGGEWEASPAFMTFFPFRQVAGHQRVNALGGNKAGLAIMASHAQTSDNVLHVIIANADVRCPVEASECSNAWVTYELELTDFVPATFESVDHKHAVIDRQSYGVDSFFFSDAGSVETKEGTGTVLLSLKMGVPSVHYFQFAKTP